MLAKLGIEEQRVALHPVDEEVRDSRSNRAREVAGKRIKSILVLDHEPPLMLVRAHMAEQADRERGHTNVFTISLIQTTTGMTKLS